MARSFTLADHTSIDDARTYLTRARSIHNDAAVRFQGIGTALGIWTCVLTRSGLLDTTPTILGLRTARLSTRSTLDVVVSINAVLDRLQRVRDEQHATLRLPPYDAHASWAGISPPLSGWREIGHLRAQDVIQVAKTGIEEVAETIPADAGLQLVQRVRSTVWSRTSALRLITDSKTHTDDIIPDGVAFAVWALGFVRSDDQSSLPVAVHGPWSRFSCPGGFILTRMP